LIDGCPQYRSRIGCASCQCGSVTALPVKILCGIKIYLTPPQRSNFSHLCVEWRAFVNLNSRPNVDKFPFSCSLEETSIRRIFVWRNFDFEHRRPGVEPMRIA
jgi:hypothetical protein